MVLFILSLVFSLIPWGFSLVWMIQSLKDGEMAGWFVTAFVVATLGIIFWVLAWIYSVLPLFVLALVFLGILCAAVIVFTIIIGKDSGFDSTLGVFLVVGLLLGVAITLMSISWAGIISADGQDSAGQIKAGIEYTVLLVDPEGKASPDGRRYAVLGFGKDKIIVYLDEIAIEGLSQGDRIIKPVNGKLTKIE